MIRALRRWLLGVEPEGPPLLADPLYRYEARRHWTPGRYFALAVTFAGWLALGMIAAPWAADQWPWRGADAELLATLLMMALFWRAPLSFFVSMAAADCIAPERDLGQLEQFIMTPVDPWRFCLARLAGRLRGMAAAWMVTGLWAIGLAGLLAAAGGPAGGLVGAGLVLVMHFDLAAMLVVDAALGLRFSAMSGSSAAALAKTCLANLVVTPAAMFLAALAGGAMVLEGGAGARPMGPSTEEMVLALSCALSVRLALGAIAVRFALRGARRAMEKTFLQPEEAA